MSEEIGRLREEVKRFAKDREWGQFHTPKNLAMGLMIEAAEVAEIFQWLTPEQSQRLPDDKKEDLADELADTYTYLLRLADAYGIDLVKATQSKLKKAALKYPIEKSKGLAKKYDEL